jgi:ABC-type spermidine/putrescine transport system permease subunit I
LAYFLAFVAPRAARFALLLLLIAPFWTSFTIRAFAWQMVLSDSGLIAFGLSGLVGQPVAIGFLYTFAASAFGLGLFATMLMTLILHAAMAGIEPRLLEASAALGGRPFTTFREIVVPLVLPAWIAGAVLSYIVAVGDYAVPTLLGGGFQPVLAQVMISTIKGTYDLSVAATQAVLLMALVIAGAVPLALLRSRPRRRA